MMLLAMMILLLRMMRMIFSLFVISLSPTREQTNPLSMPGASSSRVAPDLQPGSLPFCTFIEANESG